MLLIKNTFTSVSNWPTSRWPWALLAFSAGLLEIVALYFQYAMGLEPCVMCIYQRVAVLGVLIGALVALVNPSQIYYRILGYLSWITSSVWGLKIAHEHVLMQDPANFLLAMSCDVFPNFPSWFAVHQWFPAVFEARGTCDGIDWMFLDLTMPQWMLVTFTIYSLLALVVVASKLIKSKSL